MAMPFEDEHVHTRSYDANKLIAQLTIMYL
jgi:hypothetical protein